MKIPSATPARLPDFVEPMKAKLVRSMPSGNWIYEIKFDGYCALALRGSSETRVLSHNEKDLGKFPEVKDAIAALDLQDALNSGEIVALDEKGRSSFQALQVGALETHEFRTTPLPYWLICFSDAIKGPLRQMFFVVLLPDGDRC